MNDLNKLLINGQWASGGSETENLNPANPSQLIGLYARATPECVAVAVSAAQHAQPAWAAATPQVRSDVLLRIGSIILQRSEEIARVLSREEGKSLNEAIGEATRAGHIFQFFAGEVMRLGGIKIDSVRAGADVEITREPLGVVGLITPWNFPIAIPAWKTAPALAAGNAVILKPADITPACAHILAEIIHEAGCPAGVFNLLMGSGSMIGKAMIEHPGVAAISFTGSEYVGRQIAQGCAAGLKKFQLEMGGKNPMVVMADANIETAVDVCINGSFYSTGQRCTASSRLIVEESIHDEFVERLVSARASLKIGDPLDKSNHIGPVVSKSQLESNLKYVELAQEEGCEVIGGGRIESSTGGYFQDPAIFLGANNTMRTSREEIFGPCCSVIKVSDFDEAIEVANDTPFGLSSGICTQSLKHASTFKRSSTAGMVMVNLPTAGVDYHVPFGGRNSSSMGSREQGPMAMDFYTAVKTAYTFPG